MSKNFKHLLIQINHGVGILWLNRPELRNAFNDDMIAELTTALKALEADAAIRAVVLAGAGPAFCAGADLNWMKRMSGYSFAQNHADAMGMATMLHTLYTLKKPTIARVHGAAFAGGVGLVAACDMAVAAYEAEFCLSEVKLGLIPATISPYVVRAMGERASRRYFLSAERFTAAEAYRVGLLSDIAPAAELDGRINELLEQLLLGGPGAQALSKDLIRAVAGTPLTADLVSDTASRIATARASVEGKEGVTAFLEKRAPAWINPAKPAATGKPAAKPAKKARKKT
ncbi:MAG: enoyl-CoA hydratase/isomerase family protein [Betaproteobacteria bacterium]